MGADTLPRGGAGGAPSAPGGLVGDEAPGGVGGEREDARHDPELLLSLEDEEVAHTELSGRGGEVPPPLRALAEAEGRVDRARRRHAVRPFGAGRCAGTGTWGSSEAVFWATPSLRVAWWARAARTKSLNRGWA